LGLGAFVGWWGVQQVHEEAGGLRSRSNSSRDTTGPMCAGAGTAFTVACVVCVCVCVHARSCESFRTRRRIAGGKEEACVPIDSKRTSTLAPVLAEVSKYRKPSSSANVCPACA
jgi:hypothetical protein